MKTELSHFDKVLVKKIALDLQVSIEDDGMSPEQAVNWFTGEEAVNMYVNDFGFTHYEPATAMKIARILLNK